MYSIVTADDECGFIEEKIRAKGVNKKLKHGEFVDVLFNKKVARHNMERIQSKLHSLSLTMFLKFHYLALTIEGIY